MDDEHFLGRRLKAERERRRITLDSIAANTKIPVALLKSLERDDFTHWPTGIFRRSFVRSYAVAVGLDPDDTLQEFLERYPDPSTVPVPDSPAPSAEVVPAANRRLTKKPVLRLTLADEPHVFTADAVLRGSYRRVLAVLCDLGGPLLLAGLAHFIVGAFWAPLALSLICYFGGGILVLGNTPGISLCATGGSTLPPSGGEPLSDDLGSLPLLGESATRT